MRMADVRKMALALDGAAEAPHHEYGSFRVAGRIFATFPPDGEFLHVFVDPDERDAALAASGGAAEELRWGKSVAGLRVRLAAASPAYVAEILSMAWRAKGGGGPTKRGARPRETSGEAPPARSSVGAERRRTRKRR